PVMDAAVRETGADEVSIMLPTRDGGALSVAAARGRDSSIVGRRIALDRSIAGWVASNREPVILEGEVRDSRFSPVAPRPEIRTACCVPMLARGRLVGVMSINLTRGRRPITRGQKKALHVIAGIAASALESAVQHDETRRRVAQLQSLRAIDTAIAASPELRVTMDVFLDQVARNLGVETACVRVLDAPALSLGRVSSRGMGGRAVEDHPVAIGEGHCGRAAQRRRVVAVPDLRSDPGEFAGTALAEDFEGYHAVPLVSKSRVKGVLELFHAGPPPSDRDWLDFLETLCGQAAIAIENTGMFADLVRSRDDLASAYETTLEGWSRALDLRDRETEGHTRRVTAMSVRLAREMRIQGEDLVRVRRGALLHDIGKMGIPDAVLLKPGALDDDEWRIMRRHPQYARDLLEPIPYLRDAIDIPYCHHERWDGKGYPRGLAGEDIPLAARVFSPIDVFDALTSDRPYRPAWSREDALAHVEAGAGTMFDPRVVNAFLAVDWTREEL
ncbi:MAG: GAF domain-containing protein, partial [Deltaproteobacteria bacterium]|nr:GAF domain-containing protein [Deltaproteobacteria bacterium]